MRISHHITALVINALGGGHTDTNTDTHTHRHTHTYIQTHTHTHTDVGTKSISRNQRCSLQAMHTWFKKLKYNAFNDLQANTHNLQKY